jgi:choline-sulfatase
MATQRPNFLFITADQLTPFMLGSYGNASVVTPVIDGLAEHGVVFRNHYTNNPLCVPARAAMVTGRLCSHIGSFDNGSELPASVPTFMHHLRAGGYEVTAAGKMHFIGPDQLHGIEDRLTTDIYPADIAWIPDWRRGAYLNFGTSVQRGVVRAGICNWNTQLAYDEEVQFRTLEKLRSLGQQHNERPFFLWASFTHPHEPYCITQTFWDLYEGREIPPPTVLGPSPEQWPASYRALQVHHGVADHPPTLEETLRARRAYMGMVTYVDRKVQELLSALSEFGMAGNTIVVFASDHGDMLGEHGMWFKRVFYEWSARVPLIIHYPNGFRARSVDRVSSLVDLFPTFLELAELPPSSSVDGESLAGLMSGNDAHWKGTAISEYMGEGVLHPIRRKLRYKRTDAPSYGALATTRIVPPSFRDQRLPHE